MTDIRDGDVNTAHIGQWDPTEFRKAIVTFDDASAPEGESPFVGGVEPRRDIAVVPYDSAWPAVFEQLRGKIVGMLGVRTLAIEHIGSTSVSGLAAKPVIDIDLTVADSDKEHSYVPALQQAGFCLVIREPWWYGHRMFRGDDPACNLHVWSVGSPEAMRHLIFRNWLRNNPEDRNLYMAVKSEVASHTNTAGGLTSEYNLRKQNTIREIYARSFAAAGLIEVESE